MTPSRSTAAFEALYRAEYARVLRFFRKRVGGDDAPDLAQEVFIKLFAAGVDDPIGVAALFGRQFPYAGTQPGKWLGNVWRSAIGHHG